MQEIVLTVLLYLPVILVMTWPLIVNVCDHIPAGSEPSTVSLHQLFLMEWNAEYYRGEVSYWDAPFFYPHEGVFAWSEPQPLSGLIFTLLTFAGAGNALAYNLLVLFYLSAAALTTYCLARQVTPDRAAAWIAGFWAACGAYVMQQFAVLHLLAVIFPLLVIYMIVDMRRNGGRLAKLFTLAAAYTGTWLTCAQFGLMLTILLPVMTAAFLPKTKAGWKSAAGVFLIVAVCLLSLSPYLITQKSRLEVMGMERTLSEIQGNLYWQDLVLPPKGHWLTGKIFGFDQRTDVYSWDIGIVNLLIITAALVLGIRRTFRYDYVAGGIVKGYFVLAAAALFLGFGPRISLLLDRKLVGPYVGLTKIIPGLVGIRSPARFSVFAYISLAVIAAWAIAWMRRVAGGKRKRLTLTIGIIAAFIAEAWSLPIPLADTGEQSRAYGDFVRHISSIKDNSPVLELPLPAGGRPADLENEVKAMRRALKHNHPIINGYAGYFPEPYWQLDQALIRDPQGKGLRFIQAMNVRYVVLNEKTTPPFIKKTLQEIAELNCRYNHLSLLEIKSRLHKKAPPELPAQSKLKIKPYPGDILRIQLDKPAETPFLMLPVTSRSIDVKYKTQSENNRVYDKLKISGSLLLDENQKFIYLLLLNKPLWEPTGQTRLIAESEARRRSELPWPFD